MQLDHANKEAVATGKSLKSKENETQYRRAKWWQIALFAGNNTATNAFMFLMTFVAYYATGIVGLGTVLVSTIITGSRVFDGITDPIIGLWIDKTDGKLGKFRPFMIGGFTLMTIVTLLMFFTNHLVPENFQLIYFILLYVLYIIGYTFQTAVTKSGQSVITNDPAQRPLFSTFDISYTSTFFAVSAIVVSNYLEPKHGGFTEGFFHEAVLITMAFSGLLTLGAVIGIWTHDRHENFGTGGDQKPIKLKDMFQIIKGNRPLQMLVVAASTDKLGQQVATNSIVMVMLFGILIGDYGLYGTLAGIMLVPNILLVVVGTRYASKFGTKKGYIAATWLSIAAYGGMFLIMWLGDPTQISLSNWGPMTIGFLLLYVLGTGIRTLSGGLVIPMIPDVTDYETFKNDRYAPGVIGTIFSFIDKMISSLAQTIIGFTLAMIGFTQVFPDTDTASTEGIFWVTMFLFVGVLIFAWVASLIAMHFYELDKDRMAEIQTALEKRKEAKED